MGAYVSGLRKKVYDYLNEIEKLKKIINDQTNVINELKLQTTYLKAHTIENDDNTNSYIDIIYNAKSNLDYEYIVFSGGSTKGTSYCGVLEVLESKNVIYDKNKIPKIKGYAGTSAGAIYAGLLGVGYTVDELRELVINIDYGKYISIFDMIKESIDIFRDYGLNDGKKIEDLFRELIGKKTGDPDYTIQNLYDNKKIKLVITAHNVNRQKTVYFYPNSKNPSESNIPIALAIRMSMSIPIVFDAVIYENEKYVDGGILDNYPIHVFDGSYPGESLSKMSLIKPNEKVLGVLIAGTDNDNCYDEINNNINNIYDYANAIISAYMRDDIVSSLTPWNIARTIGVITKNYSTLKFSLTTEEENDLIESGKKYAEMFFDN